MPDEIIPQPEQEKHIIDYREVGSTGLRRFGGFIYEEFLQELIGWKAIQVYKEMSHNDPTVGAVLYAIKMLCRQSTWRVQPASEELPDLEAAEFVETCMDDMNQTWLDTIDEILSMVEYGYSPHEIIYKRRCGDSADPSMRSKFTDGRIGWRKLPIRSQETIFRWEFDDGGGIQAFEQLAPPHYRYVRIPMEKALLFRTTINKNNPEGKSILRSAYRPWYMKKNIENIEGIGIERDLAGLPVAHVPAEILSINASQQQKQLLAAIKTIVTNIRRDEQEGIVFPQAYSADGKPLYELKLLSTGGSRQFDTDKIVQRYDQRIAMTALADFMLIGQQSVGSFALVDSKTNLFAMAIGGILDMVCGVFNRHAIPRLFKLNPDLQVSEYPKILHGDLESININELGSYISSLAGAGMPLFPDEKLENYLRKAAGMPQLPDEKPSLSLRVQPKPPKPEQVVEIPPEKGTSNPANFGWGDTTPVNGQPRTATETTNVLGNEQGIGEANRPGLIRPMR